jgi:hypothetical protein
MKKLLPALIILLATAALGQTTAEPGDTVIVDENITNTSEIINSYPFDSQLDGRNLSVELPNDLAPQTYEQNIAFNNSSKTYNIQIQEVFNYSVNQSKFSGNVNLGSSGEITAFELSPEGNTRSSVDTSVEGNISELISVPGSISMVQGVDREVLLSYQISRSEETGLYNGTLDLERDDSTNSLNLSLQVQDKIDPEVGNTSVESYMAFDSENFTITVSDNAGIYKVNSTISEIVNGSKEFREDYELSSMPNSDEYSFKPDINKPGRYVVDFFITDSGNNTVNTSEEFDVLQLDALDINNDRTLQFSDYRVGSMNEEDLGDNSIGTDVEITLDDFSQDMEEEEWEISVLSDQEGPKYLNSVNDSIFFSEKANLSLRIETEEAESFNGRLDFDGLQYHEEVDSVSFSGQFLDCRVPQRDQFKVLDRNVTLEPKRSDSCENSGWEISYFAEAESVPKDADLANSINILVPSEIQERQRKSLRLPRKTVSYITR